MCVRQRARVRAKRAVPCGLSECVLGTGERVWEEGGGGAWMQLTRHCSKERRWRDLFEAGMCNSSVDAKKMEREMREGLQK